jgi:DNA mismatch repair ATPase MutS
MENYNNQQNDDGNDFTNRTNYHTSCVPNSIKIGTDNSKINIITGPNAGGKSMTLRTFGIITYLAHVGCFVPAQRAVIGICDTLVCFQKVQDSINNNISTFAADIGSLSYIVNNATKYSLILLDEVGVGTTTADAIGLFVGIVQYFRSKGENSPKLILTTHFHEILTYNLIKQDIYLRFYSISSLYKRTNINQFNNTLNYGSKNDNNDRKIDNNTKIEMITYLYKLVPGWDAENLVEYGIMCSRDAGMPDGILSRTRSLAALNCEEESRLDNQTDVNIKLKTPKRKNKITPISLLYFLLGETQFQSMIGKTNNNSAQSAQLQQSDHMLTSHNNSKLTQGIPPASHVIVHFELNDALDLFREYFALVKILQSLVPFNPNRFASQNHIKAYLPQLTPKIRQDVVNFLITLRNYLTRLSGGK